VKIPNKKGVEILIKKIFKLLFPLEEKIDESEITYAGKVISEQFELIISGIIPER